MLVRRGFLWLVGTTGIGLLAAALMVGLVARAALEQAALERLARQAAALAEALASPNAPPLPRGALVVTGEGSRIAGDPQSDPTLLETVLRRAADGSGGRLGARPAAIAHARGLVALQPMTASGGAVVGAVVLVEPAARVEARLGTILVTALRDAGLVFLLCVPAAWIGTRLLLGPIATAAKGGGVLLDSLLAADLAAEQAEVPFQAAALLETSPDGTDPTVVAAVRAAGEMLARIDATAAAILQAEDGTARA